MPYASKNIDRIYTTSFLHEPGPHDEWEPYEDTPEEYLEAIQNPKVMRYAVKTVKAGRWLECIIYPLWRSSRDVPRKPKYQLTTEQAAAQNEKELRRRVTRIINENFTPHVDYWATFTCDDNHLTDTEEQGEKIVSRFIRRLRYMAKKAKQEIKYAATVEYKEARDKFHRQIINEDTGQPMIRTHIHIVMNAIAEERQLVECWESGKICSVRLLQPDETGFCGLAHYITKESRAGRRRFRCSKNLRKPRETMSLNNRNATKNKIQNIAAFEDIRKQFFEKLYGGKYRFVDCRSSYNQINDGTYLYARMEMKPPDAAGRHRAPDRGGG